jgi:hypothetical protein
VGHEDTHEAGSTEDHSATRWESFFKVHDTALPKSALLDYGWGLEGIMLEATHMGLSTLWLGGTLSRGDFGTALAVSEETEYVPAVSPVGYVEHNPGFVKRLFGRSKAEAPEHLPPQTLDPSEKNAWEIMFFEDRWGHPLKQSDIDPAYQAALEAVRLGPSAFNRQPAHVVLHEGMWHFFSSPTSRFYSWLDMGIAMRHFESTIRAHGQSGHWVVTPAAVEDLATVDKETTYVTSWVPEKAGAETVEGCAAE